MKKTILGLAVAVGLGVNAFALEIAGFKVVGSISPGDPADAPTEVFFVNHLLGMGANETETITDPNPPNKKEWTFRTYDDDFNGSVSEAEYYKADPPGPNPVASGWEYVLGKYGNDSIVWYIGGATFNVPLNLGGEFGQRGLSHWSGFNEVTVPDAGTSLMFLGLGTLAIGLIRRRSA